MPRTKVTMPEVMLPMRLVICGRSVSVAQRVIWSEALFSRLTAPSLSSG